MDLWFQDRNSSLVSHFDLFQFSARNTTTKLELDRVRERPDSRLYLSSQLSLQRQ